MCCDNPLLRLLYCPIAMVALCLDSSNRNYVKAAVRALFRALEKLDGKDSYRYMMLYDVMWLTIRCAVESSYCGYQKKECHMLLESPQDNPYQYCCCCYDDLPKDSYCKYCLKYAFKDCSNLPNDSSYRLGMLPQDNYCK